MMDDTQVAPLDDTADEPTLSPLATAQEYAAAPVEPTGGPEPENEPPSEPDPASPPASAEPADTPPQEREQEQPAGITQPSPEPPAAAASHGAESPDALETQAPDMPPPGGTAEMDAYWAGVLTGNPATVPAQVRALAGADDDSLDVEEQDYRLLGTINRSWAVDHLGAGKEAVLDGWPYCREQLAQCLGVADDEREVFMGLSAREEDKPRREAGKRIFQKAYLAGLQGGDHYELSPRREGLDAADLEAAEALALEAFDQGALARRRWLPLARQVARGVEAFSAAEEDFLSAPRVFAAAPDLLQAVDKVAELGGEDQETVFYLASQQAKRNRPAEAEGLGSRLVRAVRRGAGNIGMGVAQAFNHAAMVSLDNLGGMWGGQTGKAMEKAADVWDRRSAVLQRLRDMTQQEVAPLYPADASSRAESYLIDAAEATPAAMLSLCGGTGFAALAACGMGDSVAAARSLNPQGDHELQLAAGMIGGAVQGAIYMGMGRLGGRMFEQSVARFMKSRGSGVGVFSMNALKSAGAASLHGTELVAAGKVARAAEMGLQEVAARLSNTASNIDWKSFGDNLTDIETNMRESARSLPFLLIGSGRVALRHFRSPRAVLGDGLALRDWGIDDATCSEIVNAPDIDSQSRMLGEALRGSRRWSAPGFMPEIVRAMNLLNGDYFKGFRNVDCVRDFLNMPAERSMLETKVIVDRDATAPEVLDLEGHANSRYLEEHLKKKEKFAEAMRFWDKLYQLSHVAENTPRLYFGTLPPGYEAPADDRMNFYQGITGGKGAIIPRRMHSRGYYNPQGESERLALLRDRAQECIDLSYQFVMSSYSVDAIIANSRKVSQNTVPVEETRNDIIGQTAKAVFDMAMGMKPKDSMEKLASFIIKHCIRRHYRGYPPMWLKSLQVKEIKEMYKTTPQFSLARDWKHPDYRNVQRVIVGLNACARTLVRLLPMTSDFQTALVRGMSPLQAYHHLLVRELGYDPKAVTDYPMQEIQDSSNDTDMEHFSATNRKAFDLSLHLWGADLEQCQGEDGVTYWRARRPDSGFTHWHAEPKDAVNELSFCLAPYFGQLGKGIHHWLFKSSIRGRFDLEEAPKVSYRKFSGFDQLCAIATNDLRDYWHRFVTRTQPGFAPTRLRKMQTGRNAKNPLDIWVKTPEGGGAGVDVGMDALSLFTPATAIQSRFLVFWERAFQSGLLSVQDAGEFLMQRGYLTPKRYQKILDYSKVLPFPKNPNTPLRLTPPPDIAGMNRAMASEMARFHGLYYFSDLHNQQLPETVKSWFRMVPFCPDMPEEDYAQGLRVRAGYQKRGGVAWGNRYVSMHLKQLAPALDKMRQELADSPLPEGRIAELFRCATGESEAQRHEQGWCYHYSGPAVFRCTPQKDWNLMLDPLRTWELLSDEEKQDARVRLESFCLEDPSQDAIDAAGRGEEPDYLEYSLRQLDRVLKRFPDLHRYAPASDNIHAVHLLQLNDALPQHNPDAWPATRPVPLSWSADFIGSYAVQSLSSVPDVLAKDAEAMSSLRFLDTLRRVAIRRPFALGYGIWWDKKLYGGPYGRRPGGLEAWSVEEPLEPLFRLLNHVHAFCKESKRDSFPVCGVMLKGAEWSRNDFAELACASVYRAPKDRARVYRLMPGYPDSTNPLVRAPYVVPCHGGVYMSGNTPIRNAPDLHRSFCPLEHFHPSYVRYYKKSNLRQWRDLTLDSVLDSLMDRPTYLKACADSDNAVVGMGELLMRLCEDTGFCLTITPDAPHELTRQQAHIVNIATAMLECMRQGVSPQSMEELRNALLPVQKDYRLRYEVLTMLRNCYDAAKASTKTYTSLSQQMWEDWGAEDGDDGDSGAAPQLHQGELRFDGDDEER